MSSESDILGMAFAADRERDRREARMNKSVCDLIEALERLAELARGIGTANPKPTAQEATPEANKKQQIETAIRNLRNATEVLAAYCGVKL